MSVTASPTISFAQATFSPEIESLATAFCDRLKKVDPASALYREHCSRPENWFKLKLHLLFGATTLLRGLDIPVATLTGAIKGLTERRGNQPIPFEASFFSQSGFDSLHALAIGQYSALLGLPHVFWIAVGFQLMDQELERICKPWHVRFARVKTHPCFFVRETHAMRTHWVNQVSNAIRKQKIRLFGVKPKVQFERISFDNATDATFCETQQKAHAIFRDHRRDLNRQSLMNLDFQLQFTQQPESLFQPKVRVIETQHQILRPDSVPVPDRQIIIGMSPDFAHLQESLNHRLAPSVPLLQKELKKLHRDFKRLLKSKQHAECEQQKEKFKFSLARYREILEELKKYPFLNRETDTQLSEKVYRQSRARWEFVSSNDLTNLHSIFQDPTVKDLVILAHARDSGELVDAHGNLIPDSLFQSIGPNLRSIFIFSCSGKSATQRYFDRMTARRESYFPKRLAFYVDSLLPGIKQAAPIQLFPRAMRFVDQLLGLWSLEEAMLLGEMTLPEEDSAPAAIASKRCLLTLPRDWVEQQTAGTILIRESTNQTIVGVLDSTRETDSRIHEFPIPCDSRQFNLTNVHDQTGRDWMIAPEKLDASEWISMSGSSIGADGSSSSPDSRPNITIHRFGNQIFSVGIEFSR